METTNTSNPYQAPQSEMGATAEEYQPKAFAWSGRIGRARYFAYLMGSYLLAILLVAIVVALGSLISIGANSNIMFGILAIVIYIPMAIAAFVLARRRFNDLDKSGWFSLLFFIPFINFIAALFIMFAPGTQGPNKYGPAPNKNPKSVLVLAWLFPIVMLVGILAAVAIPSYNDYITRAQQSQIDQERLFEETMKKLEEAKAKRQ